MSAPEKLRVSVTQLGSVGVVPDQTPQSLPPEVFTDGSNNVRFAEGEVRSFPGYEEVALSGSETGIVFAQPYRASTGQQGLLLCTTTNIYEYFFDSTDTVTRTSGAYNWNFGNEGSSFTGVDFHGVAIINKFDDYPQMYTIGASDFDDLTWDAGAATTWADETTKCKVMRAYGNILFAGNLYDGTTRYPQMVRWSDVADTGGVPATWDETDTTALAGKVELMDTNGPVLDFLAMGEAMICYKSDAVYRADYVGSPYVFDFNLVTKADGIVNTNCVVDIGGPHVAWMRSGPAIYDGTAFTPIAYGRVRRELADDPTDFGRAFLAHHAARNEVWFCYYDGVGAYTAPNKAWVFNYVDKTWSVTDLPTATSWICGNVDNLGAALGDGVGADTTSYLSSLPVLYGCAGGASTGVPVLFDQDPDNAGDAKTCIAEKRGLVIGDLAQVNMVTAIYPHMSGSAVNVYLGTQDHPEDSVTWDSGQTFTPGTDRKVDVRGTAAVHALKFQSATKGASWTLTGYELEYAPAGRR